MIEFR